MKRYIGTWTKEGETSPEVAELIIDGNHIEFYRRDYGEIFPCAFIGSEGEHRYKVFTKGRSAAGVNRTLDMVTSYRTFFVLQQNGEFPEGMEISGIKDCSFIIPELIDWLGIKTIEFGATENQELIATERNLPPLVLHSANPHIEIKFELESFTKYHDIDTRTKFVLKNQPRIFIEYEEMVDVYCVQDDISAIMQFWGLMIGHVSNVDDIRLTFEGQTYKNWLYINKDFSYNLLSQSSMDKVRTSLEKIDEKVEEFFTNWYNFCNDEKFSFIRRMFFSANDKKTIFAEDILVQYVRILEGYHLRISGDEDTSATIKDAFKQVEKDIKKLIFSDEGKPIFTGALEKAVPDWKFNSSHAAMVAQWIASGYLGKVGLEQRIKFLDDKFFGIVAKNAKDICKLSRENPLPTDIEDEKIVALFYRKIVATRNYFSHYKPDRNGVLEFGQMNDTINVLKALLIMIFFSHMGMDKEIIRKIIIWDTELHFQTMCLRNDDDRPTDKLFESLSEDENALDGSEIESTVWKQIKDWFIKKFETIY